MADRLEGRQAVRGCGQGAARGRAHELALLRELPVVDQERVERGRLPVHLLLRRHLEHGCALLRPVQRRVALVPHVVHADERALVRERVPRLPGQEGGLGHPRGGADDEPGEDDGDAQADHLRVPGQRPAGVPRGRDEREQREQQEDPRPEAVGMQRQHRAREGEQGEGHADPGQGRLAAHDQPGQGDRRREEGELQVVVGTGEAARVDRGVRPEPVAQPPPHELDHPGRVDAVPGLPRPGVGDLADRTDGGDGEGDERADAPAAEHGDDGGHDAQKRQHRQLAEADVRLLEARPVPSGEEQERRRQKDGRDPDAAQVTHAPPPGAGRAPRAPCRRDRPTGSGPRRRPIASAAERPPRGRCRACGRSRRMRRRRPTRPPARTGPS